MTDVETVLRRGLSAYADETAASIAPPPPASSVARRATEWRRRVPRGAKLAAAVAAGVTLATGAAAAVGVLPEPVSQMLQEMRSWGFAVSDDHAELMASASRDDLTYELWLVSGEGGDECMYVRVIRAGEDVRHGGGSQCTSDDPAPPSAFIVHGATTGPIAPWTDRYGRHPALGGRLPAGATHLQIDFSDGTAHRAPAEPGGYFMMILPSGLPDGTTITSLRALGPNGQTVAVTPISRP